MTETATGADDPSALTARQQQLRDEFIRRCGFWSERWEEILTYAPEFVRAYTGVSGYALENTSIDLKTLELIYLATSASVLHMHPTGIIGHGQKAIEAGASAEEIGAVLGLAGSIGIRGVALAVETLEEVSPGSSGDHAIDPERLVELRARYHEIFGVDDDAADAIIMSDPGYFAAYLEWAAAARTSGILDLRTVALTSIALNASVVFLDQPTLRRELRAALALGIPVREILDICKITSVIGAHSLTVGIPLLADALAAARKTEPGDDGSSFTAAGSA